MQRRESSTRVKNPPRYRADLGLMLHEVAVPLDQFVLLPETCGFLSRMKYKKVNFQEAYPCDSQLLEPWSNCTKTSELKQFSNGRNYSLTQIGRWRIEKDHCDDFLQTRLKMSMKPNITTTYRMLNSNWQQYKTHRYRLRKMNTDAKNRTLLTSRENLNRIAKSRSYADWKVPNPCRLT